MKRMIEGTWSPVTLRCLINIKQYNFYSFSFETNSHWIQYLHCIGMMSVMLKEPQHLSSSLFFLFFCGGFLLLPFDWTTSLAGSATRHGFVRERLGFLTVVDVFHLSQMTCHSISKPKFLLVKKITKEDIFFLCARLQFQQAQLSPAC